MEFRKGKNKIKFTHRFEDFQNFRQRTKNIPIIYYNDKERLDFSSFKEKIKQIGLKSYPIRMFSDFNINFLSETDIDHLISSLLKQRNFNFESTFKKIKNLSDFNFIDDLNDKLSIAVKKLLFKSNLKISFVKEKDGIYLKILKNGRVRIIYQCRYENIFKIVLCLISTFSKYYQNSFLMVNMDRFLFPEDIENLKELFHDTFKNKQLILFTSNREFLKFPDATIYQTKKRDNKIIFERDLYKIKKKNGKKYQKKSNRRE